MQTLLSRFAVAIAIAMFNGCTPSDQGRPSPPPANAHGEPTHETESSDEPNAKVSPDVDKGMMIDELERSQRLNPMPIQNPDEVFENNPSPSLKE